MQNSDAVETSPSSSRVTMVASVVVWLLALLNLYHLRVADPDLWWYLRCGEDILQSGNIRHPDTYSFTAAGLPYLNHEWLTQALFAFLFNHGGSVALIGLKMVVGVALLIVLYRLLRLHTSDARIYLPLLLLAAHAVGRFLLLRPQMFSFFFFTLTLYLLELNRRRPTQAIWCLPLVMCLWANMHAAFAVGIALMGYYWLVMPWAGSNAPKRWSWRLGLLVAVACGLTLVNPFGISLWRDIAAAMLDPLNRTHVEEWKPTYLAPLTWNGLLCFGIVVFAIIGAIIARARNWAELLLAGIFALLALSAPRHIPFFAIVVASSLAMWVSDRVNHTLLASGMGIILLPVLLTGYFTIIDPLPRVRIRDIHYRGFPYEAAEFLRSQPAGGNVWSELAWGGYFMWKLSPQWKVSLDGRNMGVYPRQVVQDHLELTSGASPDPSVLDKYTIDVCAFGRQRKLIPKLKADTRWELIYEDEVAVVFRSRRSQVTLLSPSEVSVARRTGELLLEDVRK